MRHAQNESWVIFNFRSLQQLFYNAKSTGLRQKYLWIAKQPMVPWFSLLNITCQLAFSEWNWNVAMITYVIEVSYEMNCVLVTVLGGIQYVFAKTLV